MQKCLDGETEKYERMKGERDALTEQLTFFKGELNKVTNDKASFQSKMELAEQQLTAASKAALQERERLAVQLHDAEGRAREARAEADSAFRRLATSDASLLDVRTQLKEVRERMQDDKNRAALAENDVRRVSAEVEQLRAVVKELRCAATCKRSTMERLMSDAKSALSRVQQHQAELFETLGRD
jgi:chromosome segregation ATPase